MANVLQRGIEAHQRGDLPEAKRQFEQTLVTALHNLAFVHEQLGDDDEAQRFYRQALDLDPGQDECAYALALSLLRCGRYAEAWPLHERRRGISRLSISAGKPHWPEWRGEDIGGKRLAVLIEQGFGDQIMLARFLAPLRAMGAEVILACGPELAELLQGQTGLRREEFDYWCPLGSLPHLLQASLDSLPPPVALPVQWRGGGGIGVKTAGSPRHAKDALRTPPPEIRARLHQLGLDLDPAATGAQTFLDTAKIIAGLDLVITVDTSIAHLAGSIGVPTWVLLPAHAADWRWLRARTDSPWYPSVRLIRQTAPGDWGAVVDEVRVGKCRTSAASVTV